MPTLDYAVYDVFTERRLAGNPLAVVFDADRLDDETMQKAAREFNLSETTFILKPENPVHAARVRIFTPDYEMPFAGHPTVGSAIAIAEREGTGGARIMILEENIGPVRCAVETGGEGASFAEFDLPRLPEPLELEADPMLLASALGLAPHEIGFENHRIGYWSAGVPYVTIPVRDLSVAARARLDSQAWMGIAPSKGEGAFASAYVYCRETVNHDCAFHARMFVAGGRPYEDPATGSALAAFAGAVVAFDAPDGNARHWIEQGIEMGRPSRLRLDAEVAGGELIAARIGGSALRTAAGRLFV